MIIKILTFKDISGHVAVKDREEHDFWIVAVRVQLGAKTVDVGDGTKVLASNGTRRFLHYVNSWKQATNDID